MLKKRSEHGGDLGTGRRKVARPISTREPMYLVLQSTRAKGSASFLRRETAGQIREIAVRQAARCQIHLIQFQATDGALHFLIRVPSRLAYTRFIRSVSGLVSRQITGAQRGPATRASKKKASAKPAAQKKSAQSNVRFWDVLPYSCIADGCRSIVEAQQLRKTKPS